MRTLTENHERIWFGFLLQQNSPRRTLELAPHMLCRFKTVETSSHVYSKQSTIVKYLIFLKITSYILLEDDRSQLVISNAMLTDNIICLNI